MSNLTRLQAVSSSLDTAINKAESLPEAGSGGGGAGVETCTVELSTSDGAFTLYTYSCIENEQITSLSKRNSLTVTNIILNNVVCGSYININFSSTHLSVEQASGVEQLLDGNVTLWHITAKGGETAILKFYNPF